MSQSLNSIGQAFIDGFVNAVAIFTLTMGAMILTSNGGTISLSPAFATASAVAMIRFSLRLYQEDGVNLQGMTELPGVPNVGNDKSFWRPRELVNLCKIV